VNRIRAFVEYENAREIWLKLTAQFPRVPDHLRSLALTLNNVANLFTDQGRLEAQGGLKRG
jgi:hypothetical protein